MRSTRIARGPAATLLAFCAIALAILLVLIHAGGGKLPGSGDGYRVQAVVPSAVALSRAAEVRTAGIRIGRVEEIATRGDAAVLLLEIDQDYAPVYEDARVRVGLKSIVGENYVEIDPGSPRARPLPEEGVLPLENAEDTTEVDEILSALDRRTRRDLRTVIGEAGAGLGDRGEGLNRLNGGIAAAVEEASPVARVLAGQRRQLAGLVDDLGAVMAALGDRREAIRVLARRSRVAAESVAERDQRLAEAIDALEPFLAQADRTTTLLGRVSTSAAPTVTDLARGMEALEPAVRVLRPAATEGRAVVEELGGFARRGVPLLRRLRGFSRALGPTSRPLDELLRQAVPLLGYLEPYAPELGSFFANQGAMAGFEDVTGNMARFRLVFSRSWLAPASEEQKRALDALFDVGILSQATRQGSNAYPRPGELGQSRPFSGPYPRLQPLPPATP